MGDKMIGIIKGIIAFYHLIVDIFINFFTVFLKVVVFFLKIIVGLILFVSVHVHEWFTALDTMVDSFGADWLNPRVPFIPSAFYDSCEILNSFFPLDEFCGAVVLIVSLWIYIFTVKLILRILTLGQA